MNYLLVRSIYLEYVNFLNVIIIGVRNYILYFVILRTVEYVILRLFAFSCITNFIRNGAIS